MAGARSSMIRHLRLFVNRIANTVSDKFAHNSIPASVHMTLDCSADVTNGVAGAGLRYTFKEGFPRYN